MAGIASAATSVVIGHVAAGTKTIRVGAGGIMLPNHAPSSSPNNSGRWRAVSGPHRSWPRPRARHRPAYAARLAPRAEAADNFPQDVLEVQALLAPAGRISASGPCLRPARKCRCGFWDRAISARMLAAELGLPYAFASHFAPRADPGAADLSQPLQAVRAARPSLRHGRRQHHRRRQR